MYKSNILKLAIILISIFLMILIFVGCDNVQENTEQTTQSTTETTTETTVPDKPNHTHVVDAWVVKIKASCDNDGLWEGQCYCGETVSFVVPKGHIKVIDEEIPATCTLDGLTEGSHCKVCNKVLLKQNVIEKLGHSEVIDARIDPTCTLTGLTEGKHCDVCSEVLVAQEVIPSKGHVIVIDNAIPSTCISTGLTEGSHCSVCEETLVAQIVTEMADHIRVVVSAQQPTKTEYGQTAGEICDCCGSVLKPPVPIPFVGSTGLEYELLEDDTYIVTGIGSCKDTSVYISSMHNGKKVTRIKEYAFHNNENVEKIVIGNSIKLDSRSIAYCNKLTEVVLPNDLVVIEPYVLSGCNINNLLIPSSVREIGRGFLSSFYGCKASIKLESDEHFKYVDGCLIEKDSGRLVLLLGNATMPNDGTIKIICGFCSEGNQDITILSIPESVDTIEIGAFEHMPKLKTVYISKNLTHLGDMAFESCTELRDVYYDGTKAEWLANLGVQSERAFTHCMDVAIHCTDGNIYKY